MNIQKAITLAGANMMIFGMNTANAIIPHVNQSKQLASENSVQMGEAQLRSIEAGHLEVYAGCKWGHAAFDPVKVVNEFPSTEVLTLHEAMG